LGGLGPELPPDQRQDDSYSLVFDTAPLPEPLEILGAPQLELAVSADRPVMQIIVRLNDVAPDGPVGRVTYGVLNLTHRDSHEHPQRLEPGKPYTVRMQLNDVGYRFAAGHRVRVAISTSYWPMIWPAPEQGRLSITTGASALTLPVRTADPADHPVVFASPELMNPTRRRVLRAGDVYRTVAYDISSGVQRTEVLRDDGRSVIEDIGVETGFHKVLRYRIHPDDPLSARAEAEYEYVYRHEHGWDTRVKTHSAIACTVLEYLVESDLEAFEGERRIFSRSWTQRIPRDCT
jgi:hypothetical protein